jgi:hypothetical protein
VPTSPTLRDCLGVADEVPEGSKHAKKPEIAAILTAYCLASIHQFVKIGNIVVFESADLSFRAAK